MNSTYTVETTDVYQSPDGRRRRFNAGHTMPLAAVDRRTAHQTAANNSPPGC
jgi:hypothetical protein